MILKGHSGCTLELINKNTVRKTSRSLEYNLRLATQIEKQRKFSHSTLRTPNVIATGTNYGLFFCDMEYIRGVSFQDYCSVSSYSDVKNLFTKLLISDKQTEDKTQDIYKKCLSLREFPMDTLSEVSWDIPVGDCHGDLTFENILVRDGELYVIDFLDSFVESSLIDQSKLMQDTFCAWSFREKDYIPWHHLYLLNDKIQNKRNYILLLIHLYRILPYSDKKITNLVKCNIQKVNEILKKF